MINIMNRREYIRNDCGFDLFGGHWSILIKSKKKESQFPNKSNRCWGFHYCPRPLQSQSVVFMFDKGDLHSKAIRDTEYISQ